ncbi:MAG: hypothetical protein M1817_006822 [Caeruleum heppii]|nr:MAG: hypothetical protein M1817_006822 [Caeruleum heppii]
MTLLSKTLNTLGCLLLMHACYSAHEHSSLPTISSTIPSSNTASAYASSPSSSSATSTLSDNLTSTTALPLDIVLETLLSVTLIMLGLVLGSPPLKPVQWRVWAGQLEREGTGMVKGGHGEVKGPVGNPYRGLESRVGFVDIRAKRKEFADWVREQDNVVKS